MVIVALPFGGPCTAVVGPLLVVVVGSSLVGGCSVRTKLTADEAIEIARRFGTASEGENEVVSATPGTVSRSGGLTDPSSTGDHSGHEEYPPRGG